MGNRVTIVLLMLLLSACQTPPVAPTPIGTVTRPDLVPLFNWERTPIGVIFRAESSAQDATSLYRRNDIADCTIYGDNRVVYTTIDGTSRNVIWQRVSDEAIRLFIEELTTTFQLYDKGTGVDITADDMQPELVESLLVIVNGEAHRTDELGGWPDGFYQNVAERCRAVADSPAELVPVEAYLSAEPITYNENFPSMLWDAANGIDLAALSDERSWMTGGPVQVLWDIQRQMGVDVQLRQDDAVYRVAIEIPGVSRYAPLPP